MFVDGSTFAEFDTDEVLRGDPTSTAQLANLGIQGGWLLRSEAREWFGLEPVLGLDEPTLPLNMGGQPPTSSPTTTPASTPTPESDAAAAQPTPALSV